MKTVFDKETRDELIRRINTLNENSTAQWGKMNINQMLNHNTLWNEWVSEKDNRQAFIGLLFGKMALKSVLKDESPLQRNTPTIPELRKDNLKDDIDFSSEKSKWISQIEAYSHFSNPDFVHIFFGKMTKEQIGQLAYKHTDHHLRQLNS